jgi:hypothetical protein
MVPSLRILDGERFDPAFLNRKKKRMAIQNKKSGKFKKEV